MQDSYQDLTPRVLAGIAFLNEKGPDGWRDQIDLDLLDIGSNEDCVLGQIYGDYDDGVMILDIHITEADAYGFTSFLNMWDDLTRLWVQELRK